MMSFAARRAAALGWVSLALGCLAGPSARPAAPAAVAPVVPAPARPVAAESDTIDPAVDPCREFHAYACNRWIARNPPPTPGAAWFVDDVMSAADDAALRDILAEPRSGAPWQFYRACLVPENSPAALAPLFAEVDAITSAADVPRVVGVLARHGITSLFEAELRPDWSASERAVFGLTPRGATVVAASGDRIVRAVEASLIAGGQPPAGASQLLRFERARARAVALGSDAELRPAALRGRYARWRGVLTGLGAADDAAVVLYRRGYLDAVDRLLRRTPVATLRAWLRWRIVDTLARGLGEAANEHALVLIGLAGAPQMQRPQWCAWQAAERFPAALGAAFVARVPGAPGRARAIVEQVQRVAQHFGPAPRVGDAALHAAMRRRFAGLTIRVGHGDPEPTPPLDGDHLTHALILARESTAVALAAAGQPVRHDRWDSLQFLPTAFHDPIVREISIGVGILRPPVLGVDADDSAALAGIVGHEMVHALLSGFRHEGAIEWSDAEAQAFAPALACLSATDRTGFTPTEAEANEALADLGGLRFAAIARRTSERPRPVAGADRRLFVEYAGFFCGSAGPEADAEARRRADATRWRVDVVAAHLPELRAAFACAPPPSEDACMPW